MFDKLKQASQLAGMLKDLPRLQAQMEDVRARLANTKVEGSSGGGAVRAVACCDLRIDSVTLDPAVFRGIANGSASDQADANRMIAEAVNEAFQRARAPLPNASGAPSRRSRRESASPNPTIRPHGKPTKSR